MRAVLVKLHTVLLVAFGLVGCAAPQGPQVLDRNLSAASVANEAAALFGAGKFAEAEQRYRLGLSGNPMDVALRLGLASSLARQVGELGSRGGGEALQGEAITIFNALLKERPDAVGVLMGAGAGFAELGDRMRALSLFEQAFSKTSDLQLASVALRNYATIAYDLGLFPESISASLRAYETTPSAVEASRHLALLNPLGMKVEAVAFAGRITPLYGNDGEVLVRSAAAFAASGDCIQARQLAERVLELGKLPEKFRRDAGLIVDLCLGQNRLGELRPEELRTWPVGMVLGATTKNR